MQRLPPCTNPRQRVPQRFGLAARFRLPLPKRPDPRLQVRAQLLDLLQVCRGRFPLHRGSLAVIPQLNGRFEVRRFLRFQPPQRLALMQQRFLRLPLLAVEPDQRLARVRRGPPQLFNVLLGLLCLLGKRLAKCCQLFHPRGFRGRFLAQCRNCFFLRRALRQPLRGLPGRLRGLARDLLPARRQFLAPLPVEHDAVFGAVQFERRQSERVLVLPQLRVKGINPLAHPLLLLLLLPQPRRALILRARKLRKPARQPLRLAIQFARLARQHLPHDRPHVLANLGISPRLRRLPFQRAELLLDFDDDVVHPRQIRLGRFQLRFRQPLLRLELRYASGLFDDRAALHWLA